MGEHPVLWPGGGDTLITTGSMPHSVTSFPRKLNVSPTGSSTMATQHVMRIGCQGDQSGRESAIVRRRDNMKQGGL